MEKKPQQPLYILKKAQPPNAEAPTPLPQLQETNQPLNELLEKPKEQKLDLSLKLKTKPKLKESNQVKEKIIYPKIERARLRQMRYYERGKRQAPPSHPVGTPQDDQFQHRAIGLISAKYIPSTAHKNSKEWFKGILLTEDNTSVDAVVLGKVKAVIQSPKLDPEKERLFVVYPRTPQVNKQPKKEETDKEPGKSDLSDAESAVEKPQTEGEIKQPTNEANQANEANEANQANQISAPASEDSQNQRSPKLHVQICGIWEPEIFQQGMELKPDYPIEPDYFSVHGEVIFQNQEEQWILVKIIQAPKQPDGKPFFFKLKLWGNLGCKACKQLWSFKVKREGEDLKIVSSEKIGIFVSDRKKFKGKGKKPKSKPRKG
ncbi:MULTISPECIES: hypothetical protein [Aerosakkonema]|uniref:hypothetical protein n=1 Tax=Aerosakkonema TaxID=1246629 RepID=UPI0035B8A018